MAGIADKIVIVTRRTRLEQLIDRFTTESQTRFYLEHAGADFADFRREHDTYYAAVDQVKRACHAAADRVHAIERGYLPTYLFTANDLVVVIGQDGLVVNAAKYLDGQPIVAVNPDPDRFDGVLLPYHADRVGAALRRLAAGKEVLAAITMAEARLSDGQCLLAFNDLFIGPRSHTSARYVIEYGGLREVHSSSGVIVATGAGSSGWLSSIYNMAAGMLPMLGIHEVAHEGSRFGWEAECLRFAVREPFASRASQASLVCGEIGPGQRLRLESRMPEEGVIFSDGIESDFLQFNAGTFASIGIAARKTRLAKPD